MNVLSDADKKELVDRLLRLTEANKLEWQQIGSSQYRFFTLLPGHAVQIRSRDNDDFPPFEVEVKVKKATSNDYGDLDSFSSANDVDVDIRLNRLYAMVKRRVLNLERAVADLFSDLDDAEREAPST